jgi:hypothetical protein
VYRLLFLSVAEDRGVLLDPAAPSEATDHYTRFFSIGRLQRLARIRSGGSHSDLWNGLRVVLGALGGGGLKQLGLPALAGLFDPADRPLTPSAERRVDHLRGCSLANSDLLAAMRALGWMAVRGQRVTPVDYRNLGAEELGSVYESLLELVPRLDLADRAFHLERITGNDRKTTGSYYTPPALVSALLDSALDPLLDDAVKNSQDAEDAVWRLLGLTICDPACGSGHFLVAAARRIAQQRSGEDEPTPKEVAHALRDVVGHCVYGVDANELAAELAKVSLWLEALEPGRPLGFLDARIRVGNSLLGTTPALLAAGVPDHAFKEIQGDDKKTASAARKRNKAERAGQHRHDEFQPTLSNAELAKRRAPLLELADAATTVRQQADSWQAYNSADDQLAQQRDQADAWCAAFVWKLLPGRVEPPTAGVVRGFATAPQKVSAAVHAEVHRLAEEYRFFHWHLEFPEVFTVPGSDDANVGPEGWTGGFSCLLGNPPWERVKLQEQEFFAAREPEIAVAPNKAARVRLIKALVTSDSAGGQTLHQAYLDAKRHAEGESTLLRTSGRFPLTGRGDVNTYAVFAETFRSLTGPYGQSGVIVPTGIATDATTQHFFRDLIESCSLTTLFGFDHRSSLFGSVQMQFCLLTMAGRMSRVQEAQFGHGLMDVEELEHPGRRFPLMPEEISLLNPNTGTCPVFRTRRDAEITLGIYRRVPVLLKENDPDGNPWGMSFMTMFHMSNDSHLFRTREQLEVDGWALHSNIFTRGTHRMLPLYEAKMLHHHDHRWATYDGTHVRDVTLAEKQDPNFVALPRYWVAESVVDLKLARSKAQNWILGYRWVARSTDERTMINSVLPVAAAGNSLPLVMAAERPHVLQATLSSICLDFAVRQKLGGANMTFGTVQQLPVPLPTLFGMRPAWCATSLDSWLLQRIIELSFSSWSMVRFARDHGDHGAPFRWDEERRALLRAELDGAFFHQYGVNRDDTDYILDTFPIVRRKDEAKYGEYRTKWLILEVYDRMAEAIRTGEPYQTILYPPPGHGPRHPARTGTTE